MREEVGRMSGDAAYPFRNWAFSRGSQNSPSGIYTLKFLSFFLRNRVELFGVGRDHHPTSG